MATRVTSPTQRFGRAPAAGVTRAARKVSPELLGYIVLAIALFAVVWRRTSQVDGFYLDEWFYVHGAEYMWDHFPGAVFGEIPLWNRGAMRAYPLLLATPWSVLSTSTAYTITHLMNVTLLVSGIVPAALFARRIIVRPWLRVLAVALAVAVPWLIISAHLLTENLVFPIYLWSMFLIVRTAQSPSWGNQALAIVATGLLGFVRVNLAPLFVVLILTVLVAEWQNRRDARREPLRRWLVAALRRELLVVVATTLGLIAALVFLARGGGSLSQYGGLSVSSISDRAHSLFGPNSEVTRRTFMTYVRSLVVGGFVLPMALGLGAALAGLFGRLGRRFVAPAIVTLGGLVVVVGVVSMWTAGGALEDRYVFFVYTPVAIFAVAALEHLPRLHRWVAAGSALTLWALITGYAAPALNSGNFFASPPGAFWSRVVDWRLRRYEHDVLGWTLLGQTGWLLIAIGLIVLVWAVVLARRYERAVAMVLGTGLAVCLLCQVLSLDYDYKQELFGTRDAPGGIAGNPGHAADREDWVDAKLPHGVRAGVVPGIIGVDGFNGGQDRVSFWNRDVGVTVGTPWNGSPIPAPPGFGVVITLPGSDGIAHWGGDLPAWLVAFYDDPRIQFHGKLVARSPMSRFALYRTARTQSALWTGTGLDGDGAVLKGRPAVFVLDRGADRSARTVTLTLHGPEGASRPIRWRVRRGRQQISSGRVAPGADAEVRLAAPRCAKPTCSRVTWSLEAHGPTVGVPFPGYGAPGAPRPVALYVYGAHIS